VIDLGEHAEVPVGVGSCVVDQGATAGRGHAILRSLCVDCEETQGPAALAAYLRYVIWVQRTALTLGILVLAFIIYVAAAIAFGGFEMCTARDTSDQVPQCHQVGGVR
jgi:hypothetical protein